MDVGVDCGLGQVAALVASATKSDDLNGLDSLNDLFNLRGKVGQRGSYLDAMILIRLLDSEWLKIFDVAADEFFGGQVLV